MDKGSGGRPFSPQVRQCWDGQEVGEERPGSGPAGTEQGGPHLGLERTQVEQVEVAGQ